MDNRRDNSSDVSAARQLGPPVGFQNIYAGRTFAIGPYTKRTGIYQRVPEKKRLVVVKRRTNKNDERI